MPDTKPDLFIDEDGICNAYSSYEKRKLIDWNVRFEELTRILDKYCSKDGSKWDCIIPGSGGKDCLAQTIRMPQL